MEIDGKFGILQRRGGTYQLGILVSLDGVEKAEAGWLRCYHIVTGN